GPTSRGPAQPLSLQPPFSNAGVPLRERHLQFSDRERPRGTDGETKGPEVEALALRCSSGRATRVGELVLLADGAAPGRSDTGVVAVEDLAPRPRCRCPSRTGRSDCGAMGPGRSKLRGLPGCSNRRPMAKPTALSVAQDMRCRSRLTSVALGCG